MTSNNNQRKTSNDDAAHEHLRAHPVIFALIGVSHTLLTAGIVFGWASLLPLLRQEGVSLSPSEFARIFTHGAIGNYLSSLPFGLLLDRTGPRTCGMVASVLFGVGVCLCSFAKTSTAFLDLGFTLLGFVSVLFDPCAAASAATDEDGYSVIPYQERCADFCSQLSTDWTRHTAADSPFGETIPWRSTRGWRKRSCSHDVCSGGCL